MRTNFVECLIVCMELCQKQNFYARELLNLPHTLACIRKGFEFKNSNTKENLVFTLTLWL